jgi:hypothetical protein
MPTITPPTLSLADVADAGRVRLGAGLRAAAKPLPLPPVVADAGMVRHGAGLKSAPRPLPSAIADAGKVRLGAGLRRG